MAVEHATCKFGQTVNMAGRGVVKKIVATFAYRPWGSAYILNGFRRSFP